MKYVVAALAALPVLWPVGAALRGRASVRSCCPSDPSLDLRICPAPPPLADGRPRRHPSAESARPQADTPRNAAARPA